MSETYKDRLERIAAALPPGPCVLAFVPTVTESHAAGLASDLAQQTSRGRDGHTLLFSLEPAPSRLDHEIGVEGGAGLIDVIHGRLPLARAAASGRARGFIYVPAGARPGDGVALVRSSTWRSLVESAVGRGGTVIAFLPREVLEAARGAADEPTAHFDGVVWLGPEPADVVWLPWRVFGAVDLPGAARPPGGATDARGAPGTADVAEATPEESAETDAGGAKAPTLGTPGTSRAHSGGGSGTPAPGAPLVVRGTSRRARRERERRRRRLLLATMVVALFALLALAAIALVRPDRREAFLPENDPVWSSPEDSAPASPEDTTPTRPRP